jgi:hypothetical protein
MPTREMEAGRGSSEFYRDNLLPMLRQAVRSQTADETRSALP